LPPINALYSAELLDALVGAFDVLGTVATCHKNRQKINIKIDSKDPLVLVESDFII